MEFVAEARKRGLRVEADLRNEKISYKVREHSLAKVPVLIAVGKKEAAERTLSIRRLGSNEQRSLGVEDALSELLAEATPPDVRRRELEAPRAA
jgi:threonyl-tRNA synthetase